MRKFASRLILFSALFFTVSDAQEVQAAQNYIDVSDHPAETEIMELTELGVFEMKPDLQFHPNAHVTKEDALNAIAKALGVDVQTRDSDVNLYFVQDTVTNKELALMFSYVYLSEKFKEESSGTSNVFNNFITSTKGQNHPVTKAELALFLHNLLAETGKLIENDPKGTFKVQLSPNFTFENKQVNFEKLPVDNIFLRSSENIVSLGHKQEDYGYAIDDHYTYAIGVRGAKATITVRTFENGDYFLFSRLDNPSKTTVEVDVIQHETAVTESTLVRFDRYPLAIDDTTVFGQDKTTYPTGLLQFSKQDGSVEERMVGKAFHSQQLTMEYEDGGSSTMRSLLAENEALSYAQAGSTLMSIHTLVSMGEDIVEHWYLNSDESLFNSAATRENWMQETAEYYIKRNNWYTAEGPLNKMATSTEPLPKSGLGYGRNLLLVKEDRALVLYKEQGDRYFENLIHNSFVNLEIFKGDKTYWPTEVTSTYLKGLYHITAPFIDTRFNEQIALFYYNSGELFDIENYTEPLRNYADLLVTRKDEGDVIPVDEESYYITDYFPVIQDVTTHSSMNHVLGGMNLLLMAHQEFGDKKYLDTARAVMTAIEKEQDKWIRENGDIWYRLGPDGTFKGDDYQHLTLEDLINSYKFWSQVDKQYLPVLEKMIQSKATFLSNEELGYTTKIYNGLKDIGMLDYLPAGEERTDAK